LAFTPELVSTPTNANGGNGGGGLERCAVVTHETVPFKLFVITASCFGWKIEVVSVDSPFGNGGLSESVRKM
jgi:hypothetical protein